MKATLNSVWCLSIFCLINLTTNVYCDEKCGIQKSSNVDKIINGQEVKIPGQYPWYVGLVSSTNYQRLVCGGSLINDRHVLTAAYCYRSYLKSDKNDFKALEDVYVAKLGVHNVCINETEAQVFTIIKVHIHERYDVQHTLSYDDIALLVLETRVTDFMPICLPTARYETNNRTTSNCSLIGLGRPNRNSKELSCILQETFVPIQSDRVCNAVLLIYGGRTLKHAFCAGFKRNETDKCEGDTGGPLQVYRNSSATWMLLGIKRYTRSNFIPSSIYLYEPGCGLTNAFGIYTDVSHYLDWIYGKIKYDEEHNYIFKALTNDHATSENAS